MQIRKHWKKIVLLGTAIGFASFGVTATVVAYTNPELLQFMSTTMGLGLEGLKVYLGFLLDLFKITVNKLI